MKAHPLGPGEGELVSDEPVRTVSIKADRGELVVTESRYDFEPAA